LDVSRCSCYGNQYDSSSKKLKTAGHGIVQSQLLARQRQKEAGQQILSENKLKANGLVKWLRQHSTCLEALSSIPSKARTKTKKQNPITR
jgi:hypothetical protein